MHHIDNIINIIDENKLNLESCSILEIGCNIGNDARIIAPYCHKYTAIDKNPKIIEIAITKTPKLINNLTFKTATLKSIIDSEKYEQYDIIYMKNTFHFINDKTVYINNLRKLMKGICIIITCSSNESNSWTDPKLNKDNKNYNKEEWEKMKQLVDESKTFLNQIPNINSFKDVYYFN